MKRTLLLVLVMLVSVQVGCSREQQGYGGLQFDGSADARADGQFPDGAFFSDALSIVRLSPSNGPFIGGNRVILRGTGFTDGVQVSFGPGDVQPPDHRVIDDRRLEVIVPAGLVGEVNVRITRGQDSAELANGYRYDPISISPTSGSISGGTLIEIVAASAAFEAGDVVRVGNSNCADVTVISETQMTCRTPAGPPDTVDVRIMQAGGTELSSLGAFTYYDSSDPVGGGLGGGQLTGTINITALNAETSEPIDGVFVIVDEDRNGPFQGRTNVQGQVTFSGPGLSGQHNVHLSKECFENTSFVSFDARDVTVFMQYTCPPPPSQGGGGGVGRNAAFIEGELIFRGPGEFQSGPQLWNDVPEPSNGWARVAYVFTTWQSISSFAGDRNNRRNPPPSLGGAARIEEESGDTGENGHLYSILARPAALAVVAMAGLEEASTGTFRPYVMGVRRNVLANPAQTVSGADIVMDHPLDRVSEFRLGALPPPVAAGPDRFRVEAYLDLGGEGVVVRDIGDEDPYQMFDVLGRRVGLSPFRFPFQTALSGNLSDARYRVFAGWYSGDGEDFPATVTITNGLRNVDTTVQLPDFLGIPVVTVPAEFDTIPADRIIRWQAAGENPDFFWLRLIGPDGQPAWSHFVRGDQRQAPMPDLSTIAGVNDLETGFVQLVIMSIKMPSFNFDEFSYRFLSDDYWTHYAADVFLVRR